MCPQSGRQTPAAQSTRFASSEQWPSPNPTFHPLIQTFLNPPRAGLEAGRWVEKHSNGPNLLAHYFYL